jgi:glutamate---cysteine ligase / carboxylate-amine ligase
MRTDARPTSATLPDWAEWSPDAASAPFSLGIEEEAMLLDPVTWGLASRIEDVLASLSPPVAGVATAETHGSAIELATHPHAEVADAVDELVMLRERLQSDLRPLGLAAAASGTHPSATWPDVEISPGARQQSVYDSMRELARREPTFALHVHVGVPDAEDALRALDGLREELPVLLALSANSPYWQGRESGLASARIPVFGAFPRVGVPRRFASYAAYVEAIDVLLRCDAFPEPTFVWWDVRLQPSLGTLEVRIMDAQTRAADAAPLAALVQCLVRRGALGEEPPAREDPPEVIEENRFLATRDGMDAELIDLGLERRRPVRALLEELLERCAPHAAELRCTGALDAAADLADAPGAQRQRAIAAAQPGETAAERLAGLTAALHAEFA